MGAGVAVAASVAVASTGVVVAAAVCPHAVVLINSMTAKLVNRRLLKKFMIGFLSVI